MHMTENSEVDSKRDWDFMELQKRHDLTTKRHSKRLRHILIYQKRLQ